MKNRHILLTTMLVLFCFVFTTSSCSRKVGCPAKENLTAETNKKGEYKRSKSKQHLFSKKMRRKN